MLDSNLIQKFVKSLQQRVNDVGLFTEDYIRYVLIDTLRNSKIGNDYKIEIPYIRNGTSTLFVLNNTNCFSNEKSRLDLCVQSNGKTEDTIEIKFHRKTAYSRNCTTSKAGSVFNDLNRLSAIDSKYNRYLVYVFDSDMHDALNNTCISYNSYVISDNFSQGSIITINNQYHTIQNGKNYSKDFTNRALSSFNNQYNDFKKFNFDVKCIYNDNKGFKVGKSDLWCIVLEVKN